MAREVRGVGGALREEDRVCRVQLLRPHPQLPRRRRRVQGRLRARIAGRTRILHRIQAAFRPYSGVAFDALPRRRVYTLRWYMHAQHACAECMQRL